MLSSLGWSTLFSIPKAAGMQLLVQLRNSPGALTFGGHADFTTTIRHGGRLSMGQLGDLSMHRSAVCHYWPWNFCRIDPVANPDFQADLWPSPDVHRPDTRALMLKKYHA